MTRSHPISVLRDDDVRELADMSELVEICAGAVADDAAGRMNAPPRLTAELGEGRLVFTAGGSAEAVGFRAYDTFPSSKQDQVVAVWHPASGELAGVVVGELLGALRTGALGGVAVDKLAPHDATTCAVIGSGLQARTQLMACAAVRDLARVVVYSRNVANRRAFADEMSAEIGVDVHPADSAADALAMAEIALVATDSPRPVADPAAFASVRHTNTVGPKFVGYHELPAEVAEAATVLATDSPQQILAQGQSHFLHGSAAWPRIEHLGLVNEVGARSVFLSAGLSGTEVLIADHLLSRT